MGGLLKALLDRKIEPHAGACARASCVVEEGRVIGLRAEQGGQELLIRAKRGVILASGGFEWNRDARARSSSAARSPTPTARPATRATACRWRWPSGADLGNMSEAWWCPSVGHPRRGVRRPPAQPRRLRHALAAALDHRQPAGPALRQRGAELQRPDEAVLRLRPGRATSGPTCPRASSSTRASATSTRCMTVMPGHARARVAPPAPTRSTSWPRKIGVDARGPRRDRAALQRLRRRGRRPRLPPRRERSTTTSTATPTTSRTPTWARSRSRRSTRSRSTPAPSAPRAARGSNADAQVLRVDGDADPRASTPPAT